MNTQTVMTGAVGVLSSMVMTTGLAFSQPDYLHFTRHRDSNGNLLLAPAQSQNPHVEVHETKVTPPVSPAAPQESSETVMPDPVVESPPVSDSQESSPVVQKTVLPSQPKSIERQRADWGMSVVDVKGNETNPLTWEVRAPIVEDFEHRVAYHTQIEGMDTSLSYTFYQDQLAQAKYVFEPHHEDASNYIQDFHAAQEWITQSYGPPTSVEEIWLDTLYQYDKGLWGNALLRGHLVLVAEWNSPESQIALVLNGGDDRVGMVADFSSREILPPAPLVEETPLVETASESTEVAPEVTEVTPEVTESTLEVIEPTTEPSEVVPETTEVEPKPALSL